MAERRTGRRGKRTPELVKGLCDVLRVGGTRTAACQRVGINRETFYLWLEESPAFSGEVEKAESDAELRFLAPIAAAATAGDWRAGLAWLERRRPRDWQEQRRVEAERSLNVPELIRQHLVMPDPLPLREPEPEVIEASYEEQPEDDHANGRANGAT